MQYSSPEQLKGLPLKLNTDLWSFGAIAYEILSGNTLFEADTQGTASAEWQNAITQKILHEDVSEELQELPDKWKNVIITCLERDLNKRVQNTDALLGLVHNKEVTTRTTPTPTPIKVSSTDNTIIKEPIKAKVRQQRTLPKENKKEKTIA